MQLNYAQLNRRPVIFQRLTGVTIDEFIKITENVRPKFNKLEKSKKC